MENKKKDIKTIVKKSLKVILGLFISSVGAVFMYRSGLGSVPQSTIIEGTTRFFNVSIGIGALLINIFFLLFMILFDRSIIYIGTVVAGVTAGPLLDLANMLMNIFFPITELNFITKILLVVMGSILAGIGIGYYIREDFGIGTLEGVMVILNNKFKIPMIYSKWIMDILFIAIGVLMGASWGIGTVLSIVIAGPVMMYIINKNKS